MPAPTNGCDQRAGEGTWGARASAAPGWRELRASTIGTWAGPVLVAAAGAVMLHWSWRTWPDILVDFGRELYVAWRLAEGDALYRDVAYFNGPLSPYVNSLWFRLFGTSLLTLALCNLALLASFVALLYRIFAEIADRFAATSACLGFVAIFAFGQLVGIGNYNFVCPYSHDATHGVMLAFLSLFCLWLHQGTGRLRYLAASAAALGLVFLTKVEVFLAAAVAVAGHLVALRYAARPSRRAPLESWATFLGCLMAPPLLAFALLWLAMPLRSALEGILGPWRLVFDEELTSLAFYRGGMGLDDVAGNVEAMLVWAGWYGVVAGLAVVLGLVLRKAGWLRSVSAGAYLLILGLAIGWKWQSIPWLQAARPLPLITLGLAAVFAALASARRREPREGARATLALSLSLLALVLLAKMFLHARVYNYGFVLAMPATLILVVALVSWLPALIARLGGRGSAVRAVAVAVLLLAVAGHLHHVNVYFQRKTELVGRGADTIKASRRGRAVQAAIEQIERQGTPDGTLVALPEGVMLNYLTRRINPTPYINFMPSELIIFGEDAILDSLRGKPPDLIAIVHKDTSEYGYRFFGRDYGRSIMRWVRQNYHPLGVIGAPPLRDKRFGILLLERGELP